MIEGDGELRGLLVHVLEVTERYHLEMRLAHAEKLQVLGQLAGSITHDFNNLIAVILGCCDALMKGTRAGTAGSEELGQIRATALRARDLVRRLLSFARKQPPRPIPLRLDRAIDELVPLLRRLMGPAITLEVQHAAPLPLARMDPGRFDQAIINLAANARDAMPAGGRLWLRTAAVSPLPAGLADGAPAEGSYVQVEVADTGCGIAPEVIGRIFTPFFTTKPAGKGTGLGLASVREAVRQSGGDVEVASEPGAGATFRILLPAAGPARLAEGRAAVAQALRAGRGGGGAAGAAAALLLVEDEDAVRRFAARALRGHGWTVREAPDGESALAALAEDGGFDLLLTDLQLPDITGTAVIEQARNARPDLPVVIMSGELGAGAGLDPAVGRLAVLPKPFTLVELIAQVQRLLDG
ncbi:MAG: ATP-binding protein [Rhodospirillales bacterium]